MAVALFASQLSTNMELERSGRACIGRAEGKFILFQQAIFRSGYSSYLWLQIFCGQRWCYISELGENLGFQNHQPYH